MEKTAQKDNFLERFWDKLKSIPSRIAVRFRAFIAFLKDSKLPTRCSMGIMGLGQLIYRQWIVGAVYLSLFAGILCYFIFVGGTDLVGFFTLGTVEADPWLNKTGDDSVSMLLSGILAFIVLAFTIALYITNVKYCYHVQKTLERGETPKPFRQIISTLLDEKFYITVLVLPVVGVCIFNILPIIFMICIAFTNYGGTVVPPKLVDWIGFGNFATIFSLGNIASTFFKIFGWNILWAFSATFINYFGGLGLALLLNKKCVKGKRFWRLFPILAYAIPGFITLIGFKFMFSNGGPINYYITSGGGKSVSFLGMEAGWTARFIGIGVNAWVTIPTAMLLATGILSNMNTDLYEAAEIDGAGRFKQFLKITLPFVIFSTTPVLITNFINNFNNFGVFYFLRGNVVLDGYFLANDTDLLINWLYNLSIDNNYYGIGAALSLIIFIFTSLISLIVYVRSAAYKKEDTFR